MTRSLVTIGLLFALLLPPGRALASLLSPTPRIGESGHPLLAEQAIGGTKPPPEPKPDAHVASRPGEKSPLKAGLLSLLVPGAGQFYNGSRNGWIFLSIEVAGWITYASTRETGHDIEDQYKAYADGHWTFERYRDPNSTDCPANGHSDMGVQDSTLVFLYDTRRDDYYEDIGKLDIYSCGWDSQDNRNHYKEMRNDSNDFLRTSRTSATVILLNHLVSGVLAARGASQINKALPGGAEVGFNITPSILNPGATLVVSRRF